MIVLGLLRALGLRGTVHSGLPARPGRDRLRRGPGPGPAGGASPGGRRPPSGPPVSRPPSRTAVADIPARYLRLYPPGWRPLPPALAGAGRDRQSRVRPRPDPAPRGPLREQLGRGLRAHAARLCPWQQGRQRLGPLRPRPPPRPCPGDPGRGPLLVDHGAHRNLDRAIYGYNHSWAYVAEFQPLARSYARGGGRR